tara:strand:+ start:1417 stop:1545 length:129 start_codon:yes stop_codon:yes gene_type:complete
MSQQQNQARAFVTRLTPESEEIEEKKKEEDVEYDSLEEALTS